MPSRSTRESQPISVCMASPYCSLPHAPGWARRNQALAIKEELLALEITSILFGCFAGWQLEGCTSGAYVQVTVAPKPLINIRESCDEGNLKWMDALVFLERKNNYSPCQPHAVVPFAGLLCVCHFLRVSRSRQLNETSAFWPF